MDLDKHPEFQSTEGKYLKAADVAGERFKVEIESVDEASFTNREDPEHDQIKLVLNFKGKDKGLVVNWTNLKILRIAWGAETDNWVGKQLIASTKEYNIDGNNTHGFILMPDVESEPNDDIPF